MIIGCISLVWIGDRIVTVKCAKGRGFILPGGKWEPPETYKEAAARELREETGLVAVDQQLLFQGPSGDGSFTFCFETTIKEFKPIDSLEGIVSLSNWSHLLDSHYRAYYELVKDAYFSKWHTVK